MNDHVSVAELERPLADAMVRADDLDISIFGELCRMCETHGMGAVSEVLCDPALTSGQAAYLTAALMRASASEFKRAELVDVLAVVAMVPRAWRR